MHLKTTFRFLSFFVLALVCFTMVSCSEDPAPGTDPTVDPMEEEMEMEEESTETTVEEDKANIQTTFDNMLVCVDDMTSARAIDVLLRDFFNVSDGEAYNEDWAEELSGNFEGVFDFEHIEENGRFNILHHGGRYYYNHNTQSWVKGLAASEIVTVQFPTSPELTENNASFVIDQYFDQSIVIDGEEIFAPSKMHALLDVDGQRLFELNLDKVTYEENSSFEIPVEIDATLFLDPMEISLDVVRNSSTEFTGMLGFNDGSQCRMSLEADITLADDDFENLTEESIERLHAKVRIGDLTLQSLAGLAELLTMDDPNESTINSLLDLDVLFEDLKIADMEYDETEENFVLYYKDTSSESAANYVDDFLEKMEAMVVEFTGEW